MWSVHVYTVYNFTEVATFMEKSTYHYNYVWENFLFLGTPCQLMSSHLFPLFMSFSFAPLGLTRPICMALGLDLPTGVW